MCQSSSSVLVLDRTSPSLLHTFVAYTTQLSIAIQHTGNSFLHQHIPRKTPSGVFLLLLGNLRTTTTALSTTTGSELQCTAQARLVNFVVVVSSMTPNIIESRRPAIHKLRQV